MNIINKILSRYNKSKEEVEKEEEEVVNFCNPDISFHIEVDGKTGEFIVDVECNDLSEECAENLSLLIYHTSTGGLAKFFTEALSKWQYLEKEEYEQRNDFCNEVADKLLEYDSLLIENEKKTDSNKNKVAVRASTVFNLKELNQ